MGVTAPRPTSAESQHCWLPNEIEPVINSTKSFELIDGNGVKEALLVEENERFWRADPSDGLRPLKSIRN